MGEQEKRTYIIDSGLNLYIKVGEKDQLGLGYNLGNLAVSDAIVPLDPKIHITAFSILGSHRGMLIDPSLITEVLKAEDNTKVSIAIQGKNFLIANGNDYTKAIKVPMASDFYAIGELVTSTTDLDNEEKILRVVAVVRREERSIFLLPSSE